MIWMLRKVRMIRMVRLIMAGLLLVAASLLVGCAGGYTLSGKVISGAYSDLEVVSADDARFNDKGVGEAKITVYRDPTRLNRSLAATGRTHADGTFEIPIDVFGAGWMAESWMIQVERNGYRSGEMIMRLPSGSNRLLITLTSGRSMPNEANEDLWEQYEKYK